MKQYPKIFICCVLLFCFISVIESIAQITFTGPELLGRPTNHSVTLNVIANTAIVAYVEYGTVSGIYDIVTSTISKSANEPIEIVINNLTGNTKYYYRLVYSTNSGLDWVERDEHAFHTQRATGGTFKFTIISDSHLGQYGGQTVNEKALYERTLQNVEQDNPDFHLDLGDTFAMDPSPLGTGMTEAEADAAYIIQRPYLGQICHSIPLFLVLGNHENEEGWNFDDVFTLPDQSLAKVGLKARKKYFPNPIPDDFYTGNEDPLPEAIGGDTYREDYYAWEWGDVLFIVLDPYHYSTKWPAEGGDTYGGEGTDGEAQGDRWDWTLGIEQYLWFKSTLENSNAKFKFVFSHHETGGNRSYGRGGIISAPYFEWGGKNADGTWGWDTERPASEGWDLPIHQLMIANGVNAYFHGHDHIYAYEELDGIVYLECPKPDDAGYDWQPYGYGYIEGHYPDALMIQNSGHIRVNVLPNQVDVAYVRSYLPGDGENGVVAHSFTILPKGPSHNLTMAVNPTESGTTTPTIGSHTYSENSVVTITANPSIGYVFDHWTGDVADINLDTTTITMDEDQTVTAHFNTAQTHNLTMAVNPVGGGTTNPAVGDHIYTENMIIPIEAIPSPGYIFDHWSGEVANVNLSSTTVTMNGAKTVTANFVEPPPGVITYLGEIGTATSKTSGTSLVITTSAEVATGDAIIIGCATDPYQNLGIVVTDAVGNSYEQVAISICYQHVRNYIFAAYNVTALPSGSTITISLNNSITAKAAVAAVFRGLAEVDPLDQTLGNPVAGDNVMISGTTPTVGPTGTTIQTNELLIGVIGTEGPLGDNPGTWDNSFLLGPRDGTTGSDAATNITISMGYQIVYATGEYTAQKSDITNRYWAAAIATFKAEPIPIVKFAAKIFLEGPYNSVSKEMTIALRSPIDRLPLESPYNEDARTVSSIPADVSDWVLVQIRSNSVGTAVASKSAFLHKDGRIVADDGTTNEIQMTASTGDYYIVIKHRNHLAGMSDKTVHLSNASPTVYDFTSGNDQYYGGIDGAVVLEGGVWGMIAGDTDGNGVIDLTDRSNTWNNRNIIGYSGSDTDLNCAVELQDRLNTWNNRNKTTMVP